MDGPRRLVLWTLVVVSCAAVLLWALYLIRDVLVLVYIAALLAIGLSPLIRLVERPRILEGRRVPRVLAIAIVYLVLIGALVGIGVAVVTPLARQARALVAALPGMVERAQQFLIDRGLLDASLDWGALLRLTPTADAVNTAIGALGGVLGGVVGLVTILILPFYFLVERDSILRTFLHLFPSHQRPRVAAVSAEITQKVSAWLGGQLLLSAVIGVSATAALWLMGVPYFYVLGLLAAVGELIPVVGPLLAAVPAVAVALGVSWRVAVGVAVFYLIQQQVENHVLVPKLMEHQLGVSAVTVIIALLVGSVLLGIVGAILAVPTAAIAQVLVQELVLKTDPDLR